MTRQRREQIIGVSARISQLREEIRVRETDLRKAEAELDALFSQPDGNSAAGALAVTGNDAPQDGDVGGRSLADHIVAILDAEPGREMDAEGLLPGIPGAKVPSVRSALARLYKQRRIDKGERGKYKSVIVPSAQTIAVAEEVKE